MVVVLVTLVCQVSQWFELVVFTASMEIYGTAVADKLDANQGMLNRRYYRQHCTLDFGSYTKVLMMVPMLVLMLTPMMVLMPMLTSSPRTCRRSAPTSPPCSSWTTPQGPTGPTQVPFSSTTSISSTTTSTTCIIIYTTSHPHHR